MYHGPEAFSEVESRVVRDAIWAEANRTKSYLTVHSYGQVGHFSFTYTTSYPSNLIVSLYVEVLVNTLGIYRGFA